MQFAVKTKQGFGRYQSKCQKTQHFQEHVIMIVEPLGMTHCKESTITVYVTSHREIKCHFLFFFSFHPSLPILATSSGQRKFPLPTYSDSESSDVEEAATIQDRDDIIDNSIRLWSLV